MNACSAMWPSPGDSGVRGRKIALWMTTTDQLARELIGAGEFGQFLGRADFAGGQKCQPARRDRKQRRPERRPKYRRQFPIECATGTDRPDEPGERDDDHEGDDERDDGARRDAVPIHAAKSARRSRRNSDPGDPPPPQRVAQSRWSAIHLAASARYGTRARTRRCTASRPGHDVRHGAWAILSEGGAIGPERGPPRTRAFRFSGTAPGLVPSSVSARSRSRNSIAASCPVRGSTAQVTARPAVVSAQP